MARIPKFNSEEEEAEFWDTHDSTDFFDDTEEIDVQIIDTRPKGLVSVWLDNDAVEFVEELARRNGTHYRSLIKAWVKERLEQERVNRDVKKAVS